MHTPEPDPGDVEHDEHAQQDDVEHLDPDAPGRWIIDPDGDAPEPNEPA